METNIEIKNVCCLGCLCNNDENKIHDFRMHSATMRSLFQSDSIPLCFICKRMAQHAELFIQNVQSNQVLLVNYHNALDISLQSVRGQVQPLVNLSCNKKVQVAEYLNDQDTTTEGFEITFNTCEDTYMKVDTIKIEVKDEDSQLFDFEGEYVDCEEFEDQLIKAEDEDEFPLKMLQKARVDLDNVDLNSLSKSLNKNKFKKKKHKVKQEIRKEPKILKIYITKKQCLAEREMLATDSKYLKSMFKCVDCLKGFNFKDGLERHMEKHSESNGAIQCGICKQRMDTEEKLASHKRYHFVRYKCTECDLVRICQQTIRDHITQIHCQGLYQFCCTFPGCSKIYKRQTSLRKHRAYAHKCRERVSCQYCLKTYVSKDVLKSHMIMQHPKEVSAVEVHKRFVCTDCGKGFKSPSQLKIHSLKHSQYKNAYCVECDKSFKSDYILKHHLKTAAPHVKYVELPLVCSHCEKRFAIKRDLERHMNRVHLNIKPFKCDQCDKAYVNGWSLTEHKRYIHEGYKRPLKFPCSMCDKVFDRKQILSSHVRTHTGERPFGCARCPASFAQRGVLATHVRLVHLRLARDGRPRHK